MSKADELWEKYEKSDWYGDCVHRDGFLAALKEYGELVKAEAVKVCDELPSAPQGTWSDGFYEGCRDCAAAIEKMELP